MFIVRLEGSWFRHPFWRVRFLLETPEDLTRLLDSDVSGVIIDEAKGLGLPWPAAAPPDTAPAAVFAAKPKPPVARAPQSSRPLERETTYAQEKAKAAQLVSKSKKVMRHVFDAARLGKAVRCSDVIGVVDEISASIQRNRLALVNVSRLKSKDEYTCLHSVAVCALMVALARQLKVSEFQVRDLGLAGLLHDVGKMSVPSLILNKPGGLSDEEFAIVQSHPEIGFQLLQESEGIPEIALDVCRHHHEKIDGTGYPERLQAKDISLAARMGAICDVYDALTSNRAYKDAWTPLGAISAMDSWDGQFDRELLFKFMQCVSVYPVGMLVRLRSNRLALTLDNGRRTSRPRVRAFYSTVERELTKPVDLEIADSFTADQIVEREDPALWGLPDLTVLRQSYLPANLAA